MIYKNIDFHNVAELIKTDCGYKMCRVNSKTRPFLSETNQKFISYTGTGVELRFVIESGEVELDFFVDTDKDASGLYSASDKYSQICNPTLIVYYGNYHSGYTTPDIILHQGLNTIKFSIPDEIEDLEKLHELDGKVGFDYRVVRVVLSTSIIRFVDVRGNISAPDKSQYPDKTILFYGSSITNGSESVITPGSFAFKSSSALHCDYINLGFSGNAMIEKKMAQFIAERDDWDVACLEFGANTYAYSKEKFHDYVEKFIDIVTATGKPVLCTDIFGCRSDLFKKHEKSDEMRATVKELAKDKAYYVPGLEMLPANSRYITTDGVHPSVEGMCVLGENYIKHIKNIMK